MAANSNTGTYELERVMDLLGLDETEMGLVLGVTDEEITRWELTGDENDDVREKLRTLYLVTELLASKLDHAKLPSIARRAASAYGGLTVLEMVTAGRGEELLGLIEKSLDWSATA